MTTVTEQLAKAITSRNTKQAIEALGRPTEIDMSATFTEADIGSLLHLAVKYNFPLVVQELLKIGFNVNSVDADLCTPLHVACRYGHKEIVSLLLNQRGVNINAIDREGFTPLHFACRWKDKALVKLLLEQESININITDKEGATPLHVAFRYAHKEVIKLLLNQKDVKVNALNKAGFTPLQVALQFGEEEIVRLLIKQAGIDINARGKEGVAPLFAACQNGDIKVVKLLLEQEGIEINAKHNKGVTPLHIACQNNKIEVVKLLLEQEGIDVNISLDTGETPLFLACQNNKIEVVKLLLEKKSIELNAATDERRLTPLHIACQDGHTDVVALLLKQEGIEINVKQYEGATPLHVACQSGHTDAVRLLLEQEGIEINAKQFQGATPLHVACQNGHTEVVKLLLEQEGIEINTKHAQGMAALHMACELGHRGIIELLLKHKCIDINAKCAVERTDLSPSGLKNWTALYIACLFERADISNLLIQHGADVNVITNRGEIPLMTTEDPISQDMLRRAGALEHGVKIEDKETILKEIAANAQNVHLKALEGGVRNSIKALRKHFSVPEAGSQGEHAAWLEGGEIYKASEWAGEKVKEFQEYLCSESAKDEVASFVLPKGVKAVLSEEEGEIKVNLSEGDRKYSSLDPADRALVDSHIQNAKRCFFDNILGHREFSKYENWDVNCSMFEAIALSWLVANEEGHGYIEGGQVMAFFISQKKAKLILSLSESATEYKPGDIYYNSFGKGKGQGCAPGTFNRIIASQSKLHECVYAEMVSEEEVAKLTAVRSELEQQVLSVKKLLPLMFWDSVCQDEKLGEYIDDVEHIGIEWVNLRTQEYGFAGKTNQTEIKQGLAHQRILGDCKGWMLDNFEKYASRKLTPQDMLIIEELLKTSDIIYGQLVVRHKNGFIKSVISNMSQDEVSNIAAKWQEYEKNKSKIGFNAEEDTPLEIKAFLSKCQSYLESNASEVFKENELLMSRGIQSHDIKALLEMVKDTGVRDIASWAGMPEEDVYPLMWPEELGDMKEDSALVENIGEGSNLDNVDLGS